MPKIFKSQLGFVPVKIILLIVAILIGIGVGIIFLYQQFGKPESKIAVLPTTTKPFEYTKHGLIVASQNGLVNLAYNSSAQIYENKAEINLSGISGLVSFGDYIFAVTKNEILKFDNNLKKINYKKFESIGAIATDNKNIFISADNSFIVLDINLNELAKVKLEHRGFEKNAHDILIHENVAYLLDNIMMPIFLFRVDIKDPKNILITGKIEIHDINAHLDNQWLDPILNQWLVVQSYTHRGGSGQIVHIFPLDTGNEVIAKQEIYRMELNLETGIHNQEGFRIRAITNLSPAWTIITNEDKKVYLAQIESKNNEISLLNLFLEDEDTYQKMIIKQKDDYLFISPKSRSTIKIIKTEAQPSLIHYTDLSKNNVRAIVDIIPY